MKNRISLNGVWDGECIDPKGEKSFKFNGTVPGCVHTDLMGSAIDKDIYYRDNCEKVQWIENMDWVYSRSFTLDELTGKELLVFEGLDVYSDIYLNDTFLGSTDDMFIKYSFDVSEKLLLGTNTVKVYFHSPIAMVEGLEPLPGAFTTERLNTRRMQCTYGWDWVGRFVTAGIYKNVYLVSCDGFSTENIYVYTEHIGKTSSQIGFEADFTGYEQGEHIKVEIFSPEGEKIYSRNYYINESTLKGFVDIKNAKLWYPFGYGEQPLYKIVIGDKETAFGIRSVRIVEEVDEKGSEYYNKCLEIKNTPSGKEYDHNTEFSGFQLFLNDIPIICKGANWVPSEPFPSEETKEKITKLLELGKIAGVNMLRVWGGGIFEMDHLYSECDRLGILVTQDFLMACGKYPENNPHFLELVRAEAEEAALRLRNHPSLMWWSGDNENAVWGHDDSEDYKGRIVTHQSILPALNKFDPRRRFLLSSPYGGNLFASKTVGTTHNTQYISHLLNYVDYTEMKDYKEEFQTYTARFIAEEPAFGAANKPSLLKFMNNDDILNSDDMWICHTKGNRDLRREIFDYAAIIAKKIFGEFTDGEDRFFKLKYLHYEWIRVSFETARRNKGFCNGLIYWMFNDCWPAAVSWAIVDYYCLPKPGFYSFKRCAKNVVGSILKDGDAYNLYLSNDSLDNQELTLRAFKISERRAQKIAECSVKVNANSSEMVKQFSLPLAENELLVCEIENQNCFDRCFFKNNSLTIIKSNHVKILEKTDAKVTISADEYVHAVELEGEFLFDDNYFSLLPGEIRTISITPLGETSDLSVSGYTI